MATDKIYTTLKQIRDCSPREDDYKKLCKSLGGVKAYGLDTPITFMQIYSSNGYNHTLWCLRTVDEKWYPLWRNFASDVADDVRYLITYRRSKIVIDVSRIHCDLLTTDQELETAWSATMDAPWAAARAAARDAARAAARGSAWDAAWGGAWAAAREAARAAAWVATEEAAWGADRAVARDAAMVAARDAQMQRLFKYCETGKRVK